MKTAIAIALLAFSTATFAQQKVTASTPADNVVTTQFEHSKGTLAMPVVHGKITDYFGPHKGLTICGLGNERPGIEITTAANATVNAVFEGTVSSVFSVTGKEQIVLVKHGSYFTVYNGLTNVSVKKGQHVVAGEDMGKVALNDEGQATLNFQLWHTTAKGERTKLNPEEWLKGS